ncbi:hypothetical protein A8H39_01815 [Paraburkholderia fungorum]|uniref:hypothetical protein n=1 Tax=Paraburkholderia fungorum TaxID=134537 RepID=UPI00048719CC|nr:hypothetical protein [Paraburkholderia fungorum]PNE59908.1 hypothetical protein A8H39_01815 [Paraburkholderia fungorum]
MKKVLFVIGMLAACAPTYASITTSIDGGTSYIHLGKVSTTECKAFLASPASALFKVALDGKIKSANEGKCHDGIQVDIVDQDPAVRTTDTSITTWPLAKDQCQETAAGLLKTRPVIAVNGQPVANTPQATAACSKSSNSISVPR